MVDHVSGLPERLRTVFAVVSLVQATRILVHFVLENRVVQFLALNVLLGGLRGSLRIWRVPVNLPTATALLTR